MITVVQETRTERVLEALRDLTSPRALVIRDGERKRIAGRDVVRGDILVLAEGDRVPADAVILECHDLQTDESLLTGESVPVRKTRLPAPVHAESRRPGGDDLPYVFSGSLVVRGTGNWRSRCDRHPQRNRQDRAVAEHARDRTAAAAGADPPSGARFSRWSAVRSASWRCCSTASCAAAGSMRCSPASRSACRCCRKSFRSC